MKAKDFLDQQAEQQLLAAIKEAEKQTSGEIRVHIQDNCKGDAIATAADVFHRLKMDQTVLHNGVLFFLATTDKKMAVYADEGLYHQVPRDFWDEIIREMKLHFAQSQFLEGLSKGISRAGEALSTHFPYSNEDRNELDDSISFDHE